MGQLFCTNCGQKLPENSKFCPACGQRVEQSAAQQPAFQPSGSSPLNDGGLLLMAYSTIGNGFGCVMQNLKAARVVPSFGGRF